MFAGALVLSACRTASAPDDVDTVVLVSIDSLRADHVGALGYDRPTTPSIDALAAHGVVFTRAYSTTSWTLPAHVSMLTGLEAETHGVVDSESAIPAAIRTIAERAQDAGVETAGVYSGPFLQPAYGFDRGFRTYANCSGIGTDGQGGGRDWIKRFENHRVTHTAVTNPCVRREVAAWAKTAPREGKRFLFVHLWDVHYDYAPPPGYVEIFDPDDRDRTDFSNFFMNPAIGPEMSSRDLRHLIALYDGEIRWTDDTVAGILADLDAAGMLRRSVVVVTSDHGDEFFEHGGKGHQATLYDEVLRIPLVVAWPGGPLVARRSDEVVSLVDVAPAVCRWLGLDCTDLGENGGLSDATRPGSARGRDDALAHLVLPFFGSIRSRVARDTKVIERTGGAIEFFAPPAYPRSDGVPTETVDRAALRRASAAVADSVRAMDARAARARERAASAAAPEARPTAAIDDATRDRLESLGYLPTGSGEP
jgi:hypothetical protein